MRLLHHPNIVAFKSSHKQRGEKEDEVFLHIIMEYVPDTVHKVITQYNKRGAIVPNLVTKVSSHPTAGCHARHTAHPPATMGTMPFPQ